MRGLVCIGVLAAAVPAVAGTPKMLKGPYLQDLAPTSITVMWQVDESAPAKLTVEGPGGPRSQQVSGAHIVEATIDNLQPSSRYRYTVEIGEQRWRGEFATAPPIGADVPFSFIVVGDSRDGMAAHRRVIERMAQEVPDFVLGTGDMVDDGSHEEQWQQFFDVENQMLRDNVYFPALGNHDRQGRGRTADTYRAYFSVPENGGETERYYAFTYGASRFLVLDSNEYSFALTDQTAWLERELAATRQDATVHHVFVVMHHPPFSISLHGGARELRERWTPLFEKYAVSAVFSGHDHVYERAEHDGIRYFVSGGGGAPLYPKRPKSSAIDTEAVKKFERAFHYLRVTVSGAKLEVTGIRTDGTTIETVAWADGPEVAKTVAPAGAPPPVAAPPPPPPGPVQPAPTDDEGPSPGLAIAGVLGALAAAMFVVRSLK